MLKVCSACRCGKHKREDESCIHLTFFSFFGVGVLSLKICPWVTLTRTKRKGKSIETKTGMGNIKIERERENAEKK